MKRLFDLVFSILGLIIASPILLPVMFLVWYQDKHSPFYIAARVGKGGILFDMVKLRSMVINADKSGVDSTSASDNRITPVGHFIRNYKLDELSQLWNVLKGEMSFVGPRPNVKRETDLYSDLERRLLTVRPGITDFASIVFSDEGEILRDSKDPDLDYNQLIRPGKNMLGIFYVENRSFYLDIQLIFLTILAIASKEAALARLVGILTRMNAPEDLILIAKRSEPLKPMPPPGLNEVVSARG